MRLRHAATRAAGSYEAKWSRCCYLPGAIWGYVRSESHACTLLCLSFTGLLRAHQTPSWQRSPHVAWDCMHPPRVLSCWRAKRDLLLFRCVCTSARYALSPHCRNELYRNTDDSLLLKRRTTPIVPLQAALISFGVWCTCVTTLLASRPTVDIFTDQGRP